MLKKWEVLLVLVLAIMPSLAFAFDLGSTVDAILAFKQPQVAAFAVCAVIGVLVHVEMDIRKGVIDVPHSAGWFKTLITYMFVDRIMASLTMLTAAAALGITYLSVTPQPISWLQLIIAGATAGYTSDSLFNRSK